jgi:hypothetical protein
VADRVHERHRGLELPDIVDDNQTRAIGEKAWQACACGFGLDVVLRGIPKRCARDTQHDARIVMLASGDPEATI